MQKTDQNLKSNGLQAELSSEFTVSIYNVHFASSWGSDGPDCGQFLHHCGAKQLVSNEYLIKAVWASCPCCFSKFDVAYVTSGKGHHVDHRCASRFN